MTEVVKDFIEATIIDLEFENYKEMFSIWYDHFVEGTKSNDYANLDELWKVFEGIGVDLYNKSIIAREDILVEKMYDYMDGVLTDDPDALVITLPDVIKSLNSDLYVALNRRNDLFKIAANKVKQKHNIVLEPFKIRRAK